MEAEKNIYIQKREGGISNESYSTDRPFLLSVGLTNRMDPSLFLLSFYFFYRRQNFFYIICFGFFPLASRCFSIVTLSKSGLDTTENSGCMGRANTKHVFLSLSLFFFFFYQNKNIFFFFFFLFSNKKGTKTSLEYAMFRYIKKNYQQTNKQEEPDVTA